MAWVTDYELRATTRELNSIICLEEFSAFSIEFVFPPDRNLQIIRHTSNSEELLFHLQIPDEFMPDGKSPASSKSFTVEDANVVLITYVLPNSNICLAQFQFTNSLTAAVSFSTLDVLQHDVDGEFDLTIALWKNDIAIVARDVSIHLVAFVLPFIEKKNQLVSFENSVPHRVVRLSAAPANQARKFFLFPSTSATPNQEEFHLCSVVTSLPSFQSAPSYLSSLLWSSKTVSNLGGADTIISYVYVRRADVGRFIFIVWLPVENEIEIFQYDGNPSTANGDCNCESYQSCTCIGALSNEEISKLTTTSRGCLMSVHKDMIALFNDTLSIYTFVVTKDKMNIRLTSELTPQRTERPCDMVISQTEIWVLYDNPRLDLYRYELFPGSATPGIPLHCSEVSTSYATLKESNIGHLIAQASSKEIAELRNNLARQCNPYHSPDTFPPLNNSKCLASFLETCSFGLDAMATYHEIAEEGAYACFGIICEIVFHYLTRDMIDSHKELVRSELDILFLSWSMDCIVDWIISSCRYEDYVFEKLLGSSKDIRKSLYSLLLNKSIEMEQTCSQSSLMSFKLGLWLNNECGSIRRSLINRSIRQKLKLSTIFGVSVPNTPDSNGGGGHKCSINHTTIQLRPVVLNHDGISIHIPVSSVAESFHLTLNHTLLGFSKMKYDISVLSETLGDLLPESLEWQISIQAFLISISRLIVWNNELDAHLVPSSGFKRLLLDAAAGLEMRLSSVLAQSFNSCDQWVWEDLYCDKAVIMNHKNVLLTPLSKEIAKFSPQDILDMVDENMSKVSNPSMIDVLENINLLVLDLMPISPLIIDSSISSECLRVYFDATTSTKAKAAPLRPKTVSTRVAVAVNCTQSLAIYSMLVKLVVFVEWILANLKGTTKKFETVLSLALKMSGENGELWWDLRTGSGTFGCKGLTIGLNGQLSVLQLNNLLDFETRIKQLVKISRVLYDISSCSPLCYQLVDLINESYPAKPDEKIHLPSLRQLSPELLLHTLISADSNREDVNVLISCWMESIPQSKFLQFFVNALPLIQQRISRDELVAIARQLNGASLKPFMRHFSSIRGVLLNSENIDCLSDAEVRGQVIYYVLIGDTVATHDVEIASEFLMKAVFILSRVSKDGSAESLLFEEALDKYITALCLSSAYNTAFRFLEVEGVELSEILMKRFVNFILERMISRRDFSSQADLSAIFDDLSSSLRSMIATLLIRYTYLVAPTLKSSQMASQIVNFLLSVENRKEEAALHHYLQAALIQSCLTPSEMGFIKVFPKALAKGILNKYVINGDIRNSVIASGGSLENDAESELSIVVLQKTHLFNCLSLLEEDMMMILPMNYHGLQLISNNGGVDSYVVNRKTVWQCHSILTVKVEMIESLRNVVATVNHQHILELSQHELTKITFSGGHLKRGFWCLNAWQLEPLPLIQLYLVSLFAYFKNEGASTPRRARSSMLKISHQDFTSALDLLNLPFQTLHSIEGCISMFFEGIDVLLRQRPTIKCEVVVMIINEFAKAHEDKPTLASSWWSLVLKWVSDNVTHPNEMELISCLMTTNIDTFQKLAISLLGTCNVSDFPVSIIATTAHKLSSNPNLQREYTKLALRSCCAVNSFSGFF